MAEKKILIVDDELDQRFFLSVLLKKHGFQPITSKDGSEGFRLAESDPPDLIILDVMMPGEGGSQMFRQLKASMQLRHIPVFMLSAVEKETFVHYLRMLNASIEGDVPMPDAYMEKPLDPPRLIEMVRELITSGSSR
jgi:two-component system phosphate regulon response regulator PhoB